jgi:hypothetical protein
VVEGPFWTHIKDLQGVGLGVLFVCSLFFLLSLLPSFDDRPLPPEQVLLLFDISESSLSRTLALFWYRYQWLSRFLCFLLAFQAAAAARRWTIHLWLRRLLESPGGSCQGVISNRRK